MQLTRGQHATRPAYYEDACISLLVMHASTAYAGPPGIPVLRVNTPLHGKNPDNSGCQNTDKVFVYFSIFDLSLYY